MARVIPNRSQRVGKTVALLAFTVATSAMAGPRGPLVPRDNSPTRCERNSNEIRGEVILEQGCYYEQQFKISEADAVLDCNGAELRGSDGYLVNIKVGAERAVVRNCYIEGGKGIAVRSNKKRMGGATDEELWNAAPKDVVLKNNYINGSIGVGIHLHTHTVGVTVQDSIIINNSSAGIYMSPWGKHHEVRNNQIENNGHVKPDGVSRIGWYRREGIAIDASFEHLIVDNDIVGNALGGILLYKNCWEHAEELPESVPRTEHARSSIIRGNRFADQPFGVWVASRQSRDLKAMECGDPTPYSNPLYVSDVFHPIYSSYPSAYTQDYLLAFPPFWASVWPDFAEDNTIQGNVFENHTRGGIRVEDDDTEIRDNLFIGDFDYIFVGAPFRARLANQPVANTIIRGNSFKSDEATTFHARLALIPDEHEGTVLQNNFRACSAGGGSLLRHGEHLDVDPPADDDSGCAEYVRICDDGYLASPMPAPSCNDQPAADAGVAPEPPDAGANSIDGGAGGGDAGTPNAADNDGGQGMPTLTQDAGSGWPNGGVEPDLPPGSDGGSQNQSVQTGMGCSSRRQGAPSFWVFGVFLWIASSRRRIFRRGV